MRTQSLLFMVFFCFASPPLSLWAADLADTLLTQEYRQKATLHGRQGRMDDYLLNLQRELEIHTQLVSAFNRPSLWAGYVNCLASLGYCHLRRSELDKAEQSLQQALNVGMEKLGTYHYENSNTLNNMGIYYKTLRNYPKALECFERSFEIFVRVEGLDHRIVGHLYNNMGVVSNACGDYHKATGYYQKALHRFRTGYGERYSRIGMVYRNLGLTALRMNDWDQAIDYLQQSLDFFRSLDEEFPMDIVYCLTSLGKAWSETEDYDKALGYYHQAMDMNNRFEQPDIKQTHNLTAKIGHVHMERNEWERAEHYFDRALALAREIWEEGVQITVAYTNLARLAFRRKDHSQALAWVHRALDSITLHPVTDVVHPDMIDPSRYDLTTVHVLDLKARIHDARNQQKDGNGRDLQSSFACWQTGICLLDTLRSRMDFDSQLFLNSRLGDQMYRSAVRVAFESYQRTGSLNYLHTAFYWMEKAQANVLFALMNESRAKSFAGIPDSLLQAERTLKSRLGYWQRKRAKASETKELNAVEREIFAIKSRLHTLVQEFETYNPDYYYLKYQTDPLPLNVIQSTLEPGTGFLHTFVADSDLFLVFITRSDIKGYRCALEEGFEQRVQSFVQSIRTLDGEKTTELGSQLYREILAPVEDEIRSVQSLIVIPHDILLQLPFEALICTVPGSSGYRFSDLDFLVRHVSVSYHYSSSLYSLTRQPVVAKTGFKRKRFVGIAPTFRIEEQPLATLATRAGRVGGARQGGASLKLSPLPFASAEITRINTLVKHRGMSTTCLLDDQATEEAFKSLCTGAHILHIASHGLIDHEYPECSAIAFSKSEGQKEDGLLYAGETYDLDLGADLVVLSCCESGAGKLMKGEGLIALTRGFLYSGARNVVVSLWSLPDRQTSRFMPEFYHALASNPDYSASLRQAKLNCLDREETAFPYFWSGIVLIGR